MTDTGRTNSGILSFQRLKEQGTKFVHCMAMSELLSDLGISHVDLWSLDVEGE
jgi:hypothetical protein